MIPKYGANYYPLVDDIKNWHHDMKLYQEAQIDYIRTGEIFNTWDTLEPTPDEYQFDQLLAYFDVALEYGIKVLLGTGSNSPPFWLHQQDPTINIVNSNGASFPNHGTYGWACYNNPLFQTRHALYLEKLITSFKDHEALYGYQINNEIGYPFMPGSTNQVECYCYCLHCQKQFRIWLKSKYQSLADLNKAWAWSTTNTNYNSFDDIEPPYIRPANW
ncbi:MAG: beta-galactosidase, partial [Bacilli bacterium]